MESIRPDDDELREARQESLAAKPEDAVSGSPGKGRTNKEARSATGTGKSSGAGNGSGNGGGSGGHGRPAAGNGKGIWLVVLLLIVLTTGGGVLVWQLQQQVTRLEVQLEDADQGVRQSRLALARFEGELSETGETLEQRGSSLEGNLVSLSADIKAAQDEIRKLWVLANERNRPQIETLNREVAAVREATETLGQSLETLDNRLSEAGKGLRAEFQADLATHRQELEQQLTGVSEQQAVLTGQVAQVVTATEETLDRRFQRFTQEQKLTLDGLDGRLSVLERSGNDMEPLQRQLAETRRRLAEAEQTLKAVDASRAQLTSRLVRLQEQVDSLQ